MSTVIAAKAVVYLQIGPSGPLIEISPWAMYGEVDAVGTARVSGARFIPPGRGAVELLNEGAGLFDFTAKFDTQLDLDTAYPNGTFLFEIDTVSAPTTYRPAIDITQPFPSVVPALLNAPWYSVVVQLNSLRNSTLNWNTFTGFQNGGPHPSQIEFIVYDITGKAVFDQFFATPVTSITLPAGTLTAGNFYVGTLRFENNNESSDGATKLIGITGIETEFIISAIDGPPVIQSALDVTVTQGQLFIYLIDATNGAGVFTAGNLPSGVRADGNFGIVGGFPTQPGNFALPLTASNSVGTGSATLMLHVLPAPALAITSSTSASGSIYKPFRFQVLAPGASTAARLSARGLPKGLIINPTTGEISGEPVIEGRYTVSLTVTDGNAVANGDLELTFSADPAFPGIRSASTANVSAGQAFYYKIDGRPDSNSTDPNTFTYIGTLPLGLNFDYKTGVISGTYGGNAQHDRDPPKTSRLSGGALVGSVQLFTNNSRGTASLPLVFFNAPSGAVNISTRMSVGTGDDVLIGGFIVTGNAPKKLVIRAIGPSLTAAGVAGALTDPMLEIHGGDGALLSSNDDWRSDHPQEITDTTVPPSDDREAAIVGAFAPGNYTAIVQGKNGATGVGLVELYDLGTASLDASSDATLANISTRGRVQGGDNVMIGGFIISQVSSRVIVRAIGPELAAAGVSGALLDTTLELHGLNGDILALNDDWRSAQEAEIIATTVPPKDDRESAIVASLPPGGYTAILRGKNGTSGIAVVEIYALM